MNEPLDFGCFIFNETAWSELSKTINSTKNMIFLSQCFIANVTAWLKSFASESHTLSQGRIHWTRLQISNDLIQTAHLIHCSSSWHQTTVFSTAVLGSANYVWILVAESYALAFTLDISMTALCSFPTPPITCLLIDIKLSVCNRNLLVTHWTHLDQLLSAFGKSN